MAADDEVDVGFGEFSLSVLIGLFVIATVGSVGSILLFGEFTPTPPGSVQSAWGQYIDFLVIAVAALLIAAGLGFLNEFINDRSPMDVGEHTGGSTAYSVIVWSMMLVALWNVGMLLMRPIALPIARAVASAPSPQYMTWTLATTFSLDIILAVATVVLLILVLVLILRLLFDIVILDVAVVVWAGARRADDIGFAQFDLCLLWFGLTAFHRGIYGYE